MAAATTTQLNSRTFDDDVVYLHIMTNRFLSDPIQKVLVFSVSKFVEVGHIYEVSRHGNLSQISLKSVFSLGPDWQKRP